MRLISGVGIVLLAVGAFPLRSLAAEPSQKLIRDIVEAKDILPSEGHKIVVSLCGTIQYQTGYHKDLRLDLPKIDTVRALAERGNSVAQCNLAVAYETGYGETAPDIGKAVIWYRKSAEQGNLEAQVDLANSYARGSGGVAQDDVAAFTWYRRAAELGHAGAQNSLAEIYDAGKGVAKDPVEALKWYRRAADQGAPGAMHFFARSYRAGTNGVPRDYVQAYMWTLIGLRFTKSLNMGMPDKVFDDFQKREVAESEQGMSPEEIAKAKSLADHWKPVAELPYWDSSFDELKAKSGL